MMIREEEIILHMLNDFCHHQSSEWFHELDKDSYDQNKIVNILIAQGLGGLASYQLYNKSHLLIQPKILNHMFLQDVFMSVNQADLLKEMTTYFEEEKIPFICMKGSVVRDSYPEPSLRNMGDIDIVIHYEDRFKVDHIMMDLMGCKKMVDNHSVWTYNIKFLTVEVHNHMFYEKLSNEFDYIGYFDDVWNHIKNKEVFDVSSPCLYVPEENYHFLYLMVHTAKHIINKGYGFRAFIDMVMFTQKNNLDWDYLEKELKNIQLLSFTQVCFAFCEKWFGVTMPLSVPLDEQFYKEISAKVIRDGLFGLENEDNVGATEAKVYKQGKGSYFLSMLGHIRHRLFPPYEEMQLIPWYKFVDGRPWLLPAAWIYRWGYCLIKKKDESMDKLLRPYKAKDKIEERIGYINHWGL